MADEQDNEEGVQGETSQQQGQQPLGGQQSHQSKFGQQSQQSGEQSFGGGSDAQSIGSNDSETGTGTTLSQGFESSDTDTLTQQNSEQGLASDQQGSGFMAQQGSGSDDYLQNEGQGDLASEDALDSEEDGGTGIAGSEDDSL